MSQPWLRRVINVAIIVAALRLVKLASWEIGPDLC